MHNIIILQKILGWFLWSVLFHSTTHIKKGLFDMYNLMGGIATFPMFKKTQTKKPSGEKKLLSDETNTVLFGDNDQRYKGPLQEAWWW